MNLTPIGSKLLSSSSSSSTTLSSTVSIQQMHADYAPALPSEGEWELLARTEKTEVQGLVSFYGEAGGEGEEKGKVHVLGWEGHPEVSAALSLKRLPLCYFWSCFKILGFGVRLGPGTRTRTSRRSTRLPPSLPPFSTFPVSFSTAPPLRSNLTPFFSSLYSSHQFTQSIVDKIIRFRSDSGVFTPSMASEATERAARAHDGRGRIGAMMLKVLLGEL